MKLLTACLAFLVLSLQAEERHATYGMSKQDTYVYVGVGWRFGFDLTAKLTVEGIEYEQGVFMDILGDEGGDKWGSLGAELKGFSDFLLRCADSVKRMEEFREKHGFMEFHYRPKDRVIEIKKRDLISVVIPADEAAKMHVAIKQIADDFEVINKKLKPAQQE
jgi:hypothetical protein